MQKVILMTYESKSMYAGELYFILSNEDAEIMQDTVALRILNDLHETKEINTMFLKRSENYSAIEDYCMKRNIEVCRVRDNSELLEEITRFYGGTPKKAVYATHSENTETIENITSALADWGFYTETRS